MSSDELRRKDADAEIARLTARLQRERDEAQRYADRWTKPRTIPQGDE